MELFCLNEFEFFCGIGFSSSKFRKKSERNLFHDQIGLMICGKELLFKNQSYSILARMVAKDRPPLPQEIESHDPLPPPSHKSHQGERRAFNAYSMVPRCSVIHRILCSICDRLSWFKNQNVRVYSKGMWKEFSF